MKLFEILSANHEPQSGAVVESTFPDNDHAKAPQLIMERPPARDPLSTDRDLKRHLELLGLGSLAEYQQWCQRQGFGVRIDKSWKERCRERAFAARATIAARLAAVKPRRHWSPNAAEPLLDQRAARAIEPATTKVASCDPESDPSAFCHLMRSLRQRHSKLSTHVRGTAQYDTDRAILHMAARYHHHWLRPPETWKPTSRSPRRQLRALLRHLFVRHEMPWFLDVAWSEGATETAVRHRHWYIALGRGDNLRQGLLPLTFTKRMMHFFLRAPAEKICKTCNSISRLEAATVLGPIEAALRWAQVRGLGGDDILASAILQSHLAQEFAHEDFWHEVLRWLVAHPGFERRRVPGLISALHRQRHGGEGEGGAQPQLSIRGRTVASMNRQLQAWCPKPMPIPTAVDWPASGLPGFHLVSPASAGTVTWRIRELRTASELVAEGRALGHCVATYVTSCSRGRSSIWTLERQTVSGLTKCLTLEIHPKKRMLVQAKGRYNRPASAEEKAIVRQWAEQIGIAWAGHLA